MKYVVLLRGINVGGKNKVPMMRLRECLESLGYENVTTYIASGNVVLESRNSASEIEKQVEELLPREFNLDSELIKVLVLTYVQIKSVVDNKPSGFGDESDKYHSDAIFLMGINGDDAMKVFNPRGRVDKVWQGNGVIYSQRLSAERTKSRLSKIMMYPEYKSMTIRSWNTTLKLLELSK